jgi:pyrimidine deaminase RibD-like protein
MKENLVMYLKNKTNRTTFACSEIQAENKFHYKELPVRLQKYIEFTANAAFDHDGIAGAKMACLILLKNRPITIGFNQIKTHTLQAKYGKNSKAICMHAEIDSIRKALNHISPDDLSKVTMIIMRSKKNGDWGMARPCINKYGTGAGCQAAIAAFGIPTVIYSTDDTNYVEYLT